MCSPIWRWPRNLFGRDTAPLSARARVSEIVIEAASVEYRRAALDLMHLSSTEEGRRVLESPWKNLRLAWKMTHEIIRPGYRKTFDDFYEAACGCDMIVYHPKAFAVPDIAMHLNIPCISMPPIPTTYPITEFSCLAVFGGRNFGARINRLSYALNAKAEHTYIKEINDFRVRTLGLGKRSAGQYTYHMDEEKIPIVYPVSKYLFEDVSSWNGHVQLPGFFFLQSRETAAGRSCGFFGKRSKADCCGLRQHAAETSCPLYGDSLRRIEQDRQQGDHCKRKHGHPSERQRSDPSHKAGSVHRALSPCKGRRPSRRRRHDSRGHSGRRTAVHYALTPWISRSGPRAYIGAASHRHPLQRAASQKKH